LRLAEFKMRLFVFFADKLLRWGHRVEQQAGYQRLEPPRRDSAERSTEPLRRDQVGPPEHWARLVASVPPRHWLELFRQAEVEQFYSVDSSLDPEVEDPSVFNETDDRLSLDGEGSAKRPSVESSAVETSRDYSANRGPRSEFSKLLLPAVSPARFLDRLHLLSQPPATERPMLEYVKERETDRPKSVTGPSVSEVRRNNTEGTTSSFNDDESRLSASRNAQALHFADEPVRTQTVANKFPAAEPRDQENAFDAPSSADQSSNTRDRLSFITDNPAQRSRPAEFVTENMLRGEPRRDGLQMVDESKPSRDRDRHSNYGLHENHRQQTTVSYVTSAERSPRSVGKVTQPDRPALRQTDYTKFSEPALPASSAARSNYTANSADDLHSREHTSETLNDSNQDCWPELPPTAWFDFEDDLFAREAEAETRRRLEQEQRGTLWSE
jgi:hypothetical protein